MIDQTHDPKRQSWVDSAGGHSDFPIQNLPLGVFSVGGEAPRIGTAIGDYVLDLKAIFGLLPAEVASALSQSALNDLFALPATARKALRQRLSDLLSDARHRAEVELHLYPAADCRMHLPARIGDYTDFYVGIHHAMAVGKLFRPDNPLLPNYKHVPIGYHGRASSIRESGVPVVRPNGQTKAPDADAPSFGPSQRLDYELELGIFIAGGNALGLPIDIKDAPDHIAGLCLLNDWSARDLQAWEYQPLGPFLAKNFQSTISPWVITAEALAPFRSLQPPRPDGDPEPLPYLNDADDQASGAFTIALEVQILTEQMRVQNQAPEILSQSSTQAAMYWTIAQLITHHSVNGCNLMAGDLLGTGTLSGPEKAQAGSLLELSDGGKSPVTLDNGETRRFLADGDEVILTARAEAEGFISVGFGQCRAHIQPAI
ncbi:fumarylacetoacetase [Asticcacaulis sp. ZE23SCel15]|uniref:fumarylacetoacetase n=1 Tax=Asticcacaulis sp. ZE23SCel15 TaxID=3059027 RepID=UPI00265FCB5E|nr:fumarylacetoacetase [Asticcacaulis sp. ZE23SCel15]WKL58323.1 fumarylacetoacetase [Asticcacaulis sp. ZE23SCel15]